MGSGMNREEAKELASKRTYRWAVNNVTTGKGIAYRKATMIKLRELAEIADRLDNMWIPCSERLPEDSGDYLVCPSDSVLEDYSDFSEVMIIPYDADCEAFGWWTERYDPISLGYVDSDFNEFDVLTWMPLPAPYEGSRR